MHRTSGEGVGTGNVAHWFPLCNSCIIRFDEKGWNEKGTVRVYIWR